MEGNSLEENKNLQEEKRDTPSAPEKKKKNKTKEKPSKGRAAVLIILGLLTVVTGISYYALVVREDVPKVIYRREEKVREIVKENITIYLPDENGEGLITKQVEVVVGDKPEDRVINILEAIKENLSYVITYTDEGGKLVEIPFLKSEVQPLDIYVDGSDLYLNMNYHFRDNMKVISQEIYIIYSIVNTLTEDGRYKRVKFLINNKEVEQLNFYKLSDFYERNLEI